MIGIQVLAETTEGWVWMVIPRDNIAYAEQSFFDVDGSPREGVKLYLKQGRPGFIRCQNLNFGDVCNVLGAE